MTLLKPSSASGTSSARPFLTANWRHLVMVNYEVDPEVLMPWLPASLELDTWEGKALASIVAFEFLDTRVLGVGIPGHRDFHEVNLRFYVRRRMDGGWRRGVVFIEELVPRRAIAWTARLFYGERYRALRMNGKVWRQPCESGLPDWTTCARYWWWVNRSYQSVYAQCDGEPDLPAKDSQAAFLTDQGWGYSSGGGLTLEYQVEHPPWRVWNLSHVQVDFDVEEIYGRALARALGEPCSALVAEGSPVIVRWGRRLNPQT